MISPQIYVRRHTKYVYFWLLEKSSGSSVDGHRSGQPEQSSPTGVVDVPS